MVFWGSGYMYLCTRRNLKFFCLFIENIILLIFKKGTVLGEPTNVIILGNTFLKEQEIMEIIGQLGQERFKYILTKFVY